MSAPARMLTTVVLTALSLAVGQGPAEAQSSDPLGVSFGAALMPYFNVSSGNLFVLLLASPTGDNSGVGGAVPAHLWFYSADCARQESVATPLTENDTEAILINAKTSFTEGAILIGGVFGVGQRELETAIIAQGVWIDLAANHARLLDPALGRPISDTERWSPYNTASMHIFAPADDGVTFFDRVIFSCPVGTTVNTLAADMDSLLGYPAFSSVTLQAVVYDDEEAPLGDFSVSCRCVGVKIGGTFVNVVRLSQLSVVYATKSTYTEISSGDARHMGYKDIEIHTGATNVDIFGRLHTSDSSILVPGSGASQ